MLHFTLLQCFNHNSILINRIMFSSPYNKILHDPECERHCCSENFGQAMQTTNLNDLKQYPTFTSYYSDESVSTSVNDENQTLYYDINIYSNQVPELQEQCAVNEGTVQTEIELENAAKRPRYGSYYTDIHSAEVRYKQKSHCKGATKRKRKRTIFSTEQIIVMERVFNKRPYVSREERLFLSQRLNITEKAIKIWFQNRRRVTEKKDTDQTDSYNSDSTTEDVSSNYHTRLDYIESQINQNIDEYGYVTLDSKSLTELVRIIDGVLSHSIDYHNTIHDVKSNDSYLMYEPVSPESLSDDNKEDISKWEPSKPEESLQRLIDIHTVLYS